MVAIGWLALRLTHSAALVGLLGFFAIAPTALLSEAGGALAAKFGPKRMGVLLYSMRVLPSGLLALASWAGRVTYADLALATLANGALGALAGVDLQDLIPSTVPENLRAQAISTVTAVRDLASFVGPLLGGALLASVGAAVCFASNAVSYVPVVTAIALTATPHAVHARRERRHTPRVRLKGVLTKVDVRSLLVTVALFGLVAGPIGSLLSVVARRYAAGPGTLGELLAAMAAGGLVASLALAVFERKELSHHHVLDSTMVVCGVTIAVVATLPPFPVQLLALGALGGSTAVLYSVSLSWIQLGDTEPEVTTRMIGIFFAVLAGCTAIGGVVLGQLFEIATIGWSLAVAGGLLAAFGTWRLATRRALAGVQSAATSGTAE